MGKAIKKLGLMEDAEGEFMDPRTTESNSPLTIMLTTTTTTTSSTITTIGNGVCQEGWRHIGEGCYQVITDK